ncbi:hypothetical protein DMB92_02095 [Campylobacter sp. MIT 99-7217]|uniref:hypothetical protein n=1 Tax=Campylobacter sp. MIT 99-7217 TaxID=535091 RepID=UPI0011577C84|nr:hypothetical protein [Campylobacter sp. MIT 99-7217]TQR33701.1 hypothetical protein DMB92_02095 [Campylobacter sp. MIT 99-7217]
MKKAIITSGSSHHQNFFSNKNGKYKDFFDKKIYLPDLEKENLEEFEYIVFASRLHSKFMLANKEKIYTYLENGGHVVFFHDLCKGFFDFISYESRAVNFWWWILPGADLAIYEFNKQDCFWKFLKLEQCKWHYHGVFKHDDKTQKIIVDELGFSILCKDMHHFKGNIYFSALDPDFHLGQGFMPITEPFFDHFMSFIEFDIKN